jgi:hypothetical protein
MRSRRGVSERTAFLGAAGNRAIDAGGRHVSSLSRLSRALDHDIVAHHFALAGMQPCANVDPEWAYFLRNRASAADTARRAIESRKNAIPSGLDLSAAKASEIASDRGVMFVEEIAPAAIAKRGSFLSRANDVSKENSGENPVHRDWRTRAGQKLLDRIGNLSSVVANERYVIFSWKLDIACARNVLG